MGEPLNLASADDFQIDPALADDDGLFLPIDDESSNLVPSQAELEATACAINASLAEATAAQSLEDDTKPTPNPTVYQAPFTKPDRDENTPFPEHLAFGTRAEFETWLAGESSWCHYVQRRTTSPEKRADERMRARIKAHERALAAMTEEEAALTPPLKKRRRARTSPILEKITYTCHHAGSYESKHSTSLPQEKLRMNTKKSVKCNCASRIVLTEMQDGECKAVYFWKHEGHDPFGEDELESGRLPKIIDDWLIAQIHAGKDTEAIRKVLSMSEEEKEEHLRKDPSSLPLDMPPPLALNLKVKYPDIYNRYRKLKGPIKATKPLKTRRIKTGVMSAEVDQQLATMDAQMSDELARYASQGHGDLARALLGLPRGQEDLNEEMLRMANITQEEKPVWPMNL